jgi:hypothetical protein
MMTKANQTEKCSRFIYDNGVICLLNGRADYPYRLTASAVRWLCDLGFLFKLLPAEQSDGFTIEYFAT